MLIVRKFGETAYRNAIKALGLSQARAGEFFEVGQATSPRWARGVTPIPAAVRKLLKVMIKHGLTVEDVERLDAQ